MCAVSAKTIILQSECLDVLVGRSLCNDFACIPFSAVLLSSLPSYHRNRNIVQRGACRALDLGRRSTADPRKLLEAMARDGMSQPLAVNDLEQPAFDMCDARRPPCSVAHKAHAKSVWPRRKQGAERKMHPFLIL